MTDPNGRGGYVQWAHDRTKNLDHCERCEGHGSQLGHCKGSYVPCPSCLGTGQGALGPTGRLRRALKMVESICDLLSGSDRQHIQRAEYALRQALDNASWACAAESGERRIQATRAETAEDLVAGLKTTLAKMESENRVQARQLRSGVSLARELVDLDLERERRRLVELADNSAFMREPTGGWLLGPSLSEKEPSLMDIVKPLFITIAILIGLPVLAITAYGLYLASMAGLIMGLIVFFFQPAPFVIGLVALLTGTDLAAALVRLLAT